MDHHPPRRHLDTAASGARFHATGGTHRIAVYTRRIVALVMLMSWAGCDSLTSVDRSELSLVVDRDAISFVSASIPEPLINELASYKVVVVGETHFLREHREFLDRLLRDLHGHGFRQLLWEWPQFADVLVADYLGDRTLAPDWTPPVSLGGTLLDAIREFNGSLPEAERIAVHGIDVNLADYGGGESFVDILEILASAWPQSTVLEHFLAADYSSPDAQRDAIQAFQAALTRDRTEIEADWGTARYKTIVDMADIERASVEIRAIRESRYDESVRLRETLMKALADHWIEAAPGGTVVNVGSTHAQKRRIRGTKIEWLGDYLAHKSAVTEGSVFVLAVSAARIEADVDGAGFDLLESSPPDELWRLMHERSPLETLYLPFDDPLFEDGAVRINFEETIYTCAPKRHYDAFVLFPVAHRQMGT